MKKYITYNGQKISIDDRYNDYIKNGIIKQTDAYRKFSFIVNNRREIIMQNYMEKGYTLPTSWMMYEMYDHFSTDCDTIHSLGFGYEERFNALSFYITSEEGCTSFLEIKTFNDLKSIFMFKHQQHKKHIDFDYRQALVDIRANLVVGQKFLGGYELTKNDLNKLNAIKI